MDSCILTFLSWISVNNEMHDGGIHLAASLSCCCQTVTLGTPVPFPIITMSKHLLSIAACCIWLYVSLGCQMPLNFVFWDDKSYFFPPQTIFWCDSQSEHLFGLAGHESLQVCSLVQAREKQEQQQRYYKIKRRVQREENVWNVNGGVKK